MSQGWSTVFVGPPVKAEILRSKLQAEGIPVLIPDEGLRTVDPYMVGGAFIFDREVQVPEVAVVEARECLEGLDEGGEIREGEQELPAGFFEVKADAQPDLSRRAEQISHRILWGTLAPYFLPIVLWQFAEYSTVARQLGSRPPLYRATIAAVVVSMAYFACFVYAVSH